MANAIPINKPDPKPAAQAKKPEAPAVDPKEVKPLPRGVKPTPGVPYRLANGTICVDH